MKYCQEFNTMVIVGSWNYAIFSPEWISKYLLENQELKIEVPINGLGSLRFSNKDLRFSASNGRLDFVILTKTDEVFEKIEELSLKIAGYLSHTPVTAIGINFAFEIRQEESEKIQGLFELKDQDVFKDYTIIGSKTTRALHCEKHRLNFTIDKSQEGYKIDFNYHFDITSINDFKELVQTGTINDYKNKALSFLSTNYELDLD